MRRFFLILLSAVGPGCSFLVHFDPETQPCDSAGKCTSGYECGDAGVCQATDAGQDAGGTDASTCAARETGCADGLDNDCDNATDCADTDCGGVQCNDGSLCTTGETCAGGTCGRGTAVPCTTPPNLCHNATGTCEPARGCVYGRLVDGTLCDGGLASHCCVGACIDTTTTAANCGGCGLSCATSQPCTPIDAGACGETAVNSGRCGCDATAPCPRGQLCSTSKVCVPALATDDCAPGQSVGPGNLSCPAYCRY